MSTFLARVLVLLALCPLVTEQTIADHFVRVDVDYIDLRRLASVLEKSRVSLIKPSSKTAKTRIASAISA
jgi:hypothetical protein